MALDVAGPRALKPATPICISNSMEVFAKCFDVVRNQGRAASVYILSSTTSIEAGARPDAFFLDGEVGSSLLPAALAFEMCGHPVIAAKKEKRVSQPPLEEAAAPAANDDDDDGSDSSVNEDVDANGVSSVNIDEQIHQHLAGEASDYDEVLGDISDLMDAHDDWKTTVLRVISTLSARGISPPSDQQVEEATMKLALQYGLGCTLTAEELEIEAIVGVLV